ncbi:MAG: class A beta-lactamase-related serine hydrolase [Chloroflexi bacterium]|nr:class A beta-lactamase-related serine hydrolase [Chloroflexota bacterium]
MRRINSRGGFLVFIRWASIGFIFIAVLISVIELVRYSRIRSAFPIGMEIADIPVGGLDQEEAAERLIQSYGVPIEIHYQGSIIQIKPAQLGFELDLTSMLTAADLQRVNQPFWNAFWNFLWNRTPAPTEIPLSANVSEARMRVYLQDEIAARYDKLPTAAQPIPGTTDFKPGDEGTTLDIDRAVVLIGDALRSPVSRTVNLTYLSSKPSRPSFQNLQIMLQQIIDNEEFTGLTEIFLLDLQNGQELHFAYQAGEQVTPDIAFTAASTIKIPVMVSVFRRIGELPDEEITSLIELMIERSENDPADQLMETVLDSTLGPLIVTDDMKQLGLENTFLAGHFYMQAPLLQRFETPANTRTDISTDPDVYNQTTPAEMGMLLEDIYQCAESGGGTFAAVFPGEITQSECQRMVSYLSLNRIGVLIQAGMPDGNRLAHKHGWITETDGLIHTIGDAGIAYTPAADYILTIFMHDPEQLVWEPANLLMAKLSMAVYNFYNQIEQ